MLINPKNNLLTEAEANLLTTWAVKQRYSSDLVENYVAERTYAPWRKLKDAPDLFFDLRRRVTDMLGIPDIEEPLITSHLSVIINGGAVHEHTDYEPVGFRHIRFNIMVNAPEQGGMPIVEGQRYEIPERGGWWFYPGMLSHASEQVSGNIPRVLCSYGYLIREPFSINGPSPSETMDRRARVLQGSAPAD